MTSKFEIEDSFNWCVFSPKGGVGKTTLSYFIRSAFGADYVTNDSIVADGQSVEVLPTGRKRLPKAYHARTNVVYDFGAMYNLVDAKIADVLESVDVVVIPTFTDGLSLQGAVKAYQLSVQANKPVVLLLNNVIASNWRDIVAAKQYLRRQLGMRIDIFIIYKSTLFNRMLEDGLSWDASVFNQRGLARLRKAFERTEDEFMKIKQLAKKRA